MRSLVIFTEDMDCPSCHSGRLRLVKDVSYSKDGYCFKCCDAII